MKKFLLYLLALLYIAFCFYLSAKGDPNAIPFFLYAGLCLSAENARWNKFLADKVVKIPFRRILLYETGVMATSVSLGIVFKLDLIPTLMLTAFSFLVLGLGMEPNLKEMSRYSYRLTNIKDDFRATIALFPSLFILSVVPAYVWSTLSLYQSGFTILGFVLNQFSLIVAIGTLLIAHFRISHMNQDNPEHSFTWSTCHGEFHYPDPEKE